MVGFEVCGEKHYIPRTSWVALWLDDEFVEFWNDEGSGIKISLMMGIL
jgi:hypothetical protein